MFKSNNPFKKYKMGWKIKNDSKLSLDLDDSVNRLIKKTLN